MRRLALACAGVAVAAGIASGAVSSSDRAFPGKNGWIVFQSFRDGNAELYVTSWPPSQPRRLAVPTSKRGCFALPTWSPDGRKIAFEYNPDPWGRNRRLSDVYVMNADGTGLRNLTAKWKKLKKLRGFAGDPAWSGPDGKMIAFENSPTGRDSDTDVWVMRADGRTAPERLTWAPGFDGDPAWSPFGSRIAFTSSRDGNEEIYLMDPNGKRLLNITRNPAADVNPTWSPDGQFVAFQSRRNGDDNVYVTNDRFQLRQLTASLALDALPSYSPDGKQMVFVSDRFESGNRDLYVMNSDGSSVQRLTQSSLWDTAPDWGSTSTMPKTTTSPLPFLKHPPVTPAWAVACRPSSAGG